MFLMFLFVFGLTFSLFECCCCCHSVSCADLIARIKEVAQACGELKHEIRSQRECRDPLGRELSKELCVIKNSLNYMTQQYVKAMESLSTVFEENCDIKKDCTASWVIFRTC